MAKERPKKHKLGFGNGTILEYEDGTVGWIKPMAMTQAFRVKVSDVTGFSVDKGNKMLERRLNILGNGTLLASAEVNHGSAEVIEEWFRSHADFGKHQALPTSARPGAASVADEIRKLGELRDEGLLTDEEFAAAKQRLISS